MKRKGHKTQIYKQARKDTEALIALIFSNNRFLLEKVGKTLNGQANELTRYFGLEMNEATLRHIEKSPETAITRNISFVLYALLARYWDMSIQDFIGRDFRAEATSAGR